MTTPHSVDDLHAPTENRLVLVVVAVAWLVVFFDGLDMFVYGAVLPDMFADTGFHITKAQAGHIGSVATFGMLVGALAAGTLTDRVGRKKVVVACCSLFSLGSLLSATASGVDMFAAARLVAGLGLGGVLPTCITLVSEFAPRSRRNFAIGALMTAHHTGGIVAGLLGLVTSALGWRVIFGVGVLPMVVAVPLVVWKMPESVAFLLARGRREDAWAIAQRYGVRLAEQQDGEAGGGVGTLFQGRLAGVTILMCIASFMGLLLVYGVSTWLPTMMRTAGYALGSSLAFLIVINAGGIVGMLLAGRFADRRGPVLVSAVWFLLTAVGVYLLGVHMHLALTYVVVFATGVFLFSGQTMVYAAAAHTYPTTSRATAIGAATGLGRFGAVFGPWMGGALLSSGHPTRGFGAFAIAAVLGMGAMAFIRLLRVPETVGG